MNLRNPGKLATNIGLVLAVILRPFVDFEAELARYFRFIVLRCPFRRVELFLRGVRYSGKIFLGRGAIFSSPERNITCGRDCTFGEGVRFGNYAQIQIGDELRAGPGTVFETGTHDSITLVPIPRAIRIGSRVWLGARAIILPGVCIGNDVIIGSGAVVTNDIPANSVAVGVPAKVVKEFSRPEDSSYWNLFTGIHRR